VSDVKHPWLCVAAVLAGLSPGLRAQEKTAPGGEEGKIITVEHADSLVGSEIGGEQVRELIGNVRFRQGRTHVTCQRARQYLATNRVWMEGVVEVTEDSMRMVGMHGTYDGNLRVAEAFDRVLVEEPGMVLHSTHGQYFVNDRKAYFDTAVTVEDSASVLTARELTYYRDEQKSFAHGNVVVTNVRNGLTITGNTLENFRKLKYSRVTQEPRVFQVDTAGGRRDTLSVTALLLESFQDTLERLVATDSVRILRGDMAAEAGVSTYYTGLDSIILERSPFVWYSTLSSGANQVSGDTIFIKLQKRKLEKVYVRERAVAISRADSVYRNRFNQMTGREIILTFQDDRIQSINVNTTATSLYYLFDLGRPNGMNKSSGDRVAMSFQDGKIHSISVITKVEGQYFPEKMIRGRESVYNLPGFNWRENHPGSEKDAKP
jgi:hypothetical protein